MIITCKECESSFNINDGLLKEAGSKVKCSKCGNIFIAYPAKLADESEVKDEIFGSEQESEDLSFAPEDEAAGEDYDLPELDKSLGSDEDSIAEDFAEDGSDGLELDLGGDLDLEDQPAEPTQTAEADLPDLDDMMEFEDATDELELDLDEDFDSDQKAEPDEIPFETDEAELDLEASEPIIEEDAVETEEPSEDLPAELELDVDLTGEDTDAAGDQAELEETDLADLEMETEDEAGGATTEAEGVGELDLSDLEEMIDSDQAPAGGQAVEAEADELDLDLEMDTGAESAEAAAEAEGAGELDLSDLEDSVESDEVKVSESAAAKTSEEPELGLELDFEAEDDSQSPEAEAAAGDTPDELDFSDLGKMLEEDEEPVPADKGAKDLKELELDFEVDLEPETASPEQTADLQAESEEEFLDIERMLETSEDAASESPGATSELELDLEGELQEEAAFDTAESGNSDLEFNLLESDDNLLQEDASALESSDFQPSARADETGGASTDDFDTEEFTDTRDLYGPTELIDDLAPAMPKTMKKKRSRKPALVFVIFMLLLGGLLIIPQNLGLKIPYLSDIKVPYVSDIKIPYLSDRLANKPQDTAGNLKIVPLGPSISYEFVDNSKVGELFVILGRVKNDYDHPRSFIKVTGKLYQKDNVLAKTATVYGGNLIAEQELAAMDISVINKRLQNRFGENKSNLKVKSGGVVPFMIVFDKLPKNLDEYTVEVAGSSL
jgi:pilus assembly protein FimV